MKNTETSKCNYLLEKDEPDASLVRLVQVDGKPVAFASREGSIRFEVEMDPGQAKHIEILDHSPPVRPARRFGVSYGVGVLFRRELSEFRDNTLSKHPAILKATREIAKSMKMTGDRKKEVES
jgi:hypothetical protein